MKTFTLAMALTALVALPAFAQSGPGNGNGAGWWTAPGMGYGPGQSYGMNPGYGMAPGYGGGPMFGNAAEPMQGWRNSNAPGRGRFASTDMNEDGLVSDEEAASNADMVFTAMDADDSGFLTVDEFMAVRMGPMDGINAVR